MPKPTETQTVLLSAAAARPDGSVLPPPETLKVEGASVERSLKGLLRHGLITQVKVMETGRKAKNIRLQGETAPKEQLVITAAGLDAIGVELRPEHTSKARTEASTTAPQAEQPRPGGKLGLVLDLVSGASGATVEELAAQAGWLPHTTRAALTRLRQRGYNIKLTPVGDRKVYRLGALG